MAPGQLLILAIIATPVLLLARDGYNRREARRQVLLALGGLLAILANIGITLALSRLGSGAGIFWGAPADATSRPAQVSRQHRNTSPMGERSPTGLRYHSAGRRLPAAGYSAVCKDNST